MDRMTLVSLVMYLLGAVMTLAMFEHPDMQALRLPWLVKLVALVIWPCLATVTALLWLLETLRLITRD